MALLFVALTGPARAATVDVTVTDSGFSPAEVTVTQGDTVTWTFAGPRTDHTVTSDTIRDGSFDSDQNTRSPNHPAGEKFSFDMNYVGEFTYRCRVHPNETGKITVLPRGNNPNPPAQDVDAPAFGAPVVAVAKRRVRFSLDEGATVTAKLIGPTRKTVSLTGRSGVNVLKLPRRLKPGRYALVLQASDPSGNQATPVRVKFRVPKPRR